MDIQSTMVVMTIVFILVALISLAVWVLIAHFVARAARMKNRSYASFFWLSILSSPIITGLIVATLPFNSDDPRHPRNKAAATGILAFTNN